MFERIDEFYTTYHSVLLEGYTGTLRPVKSFTKDINTCIDKFIDYMKKNKKEVLSSDDLHKMFNLGDTNTFTQNERNLKEFNMVKVRVKDGGSFYEVTSFAKEVIESNIPFNSYLLKRLFEIKSISDFTIYYNFLICTLREAYKYGNIIKFPDSQDKFVNQVKDGNKRTEYQERINEIYGFASRNSCENAANFAPNISYMSINQLVNLGLIEELEEKTNEGFKTFGITQLGYSLLITLNNNLMLPPNCIDENTRLDNGTNVLIYGVPGSGKSWTIEHEYCSSSSFVERLVFHPDYTNSDFVGQILPIVDKDKQVTYEFVPGPFTTILRDAYHNPEKEYVLIIEEINRGNAPAIFGDIFQLLDRSVSEITVDGVTYPRGTSEYAITNGNIANLVYGDITHKVRIPSNLSIIGTMNTSDQNVFTLDTAFQRRWQMRLVENNFDNVRDSLAQAKILDTGVTWKKFCETVNSIIAGNKAKMASAEDKRLGVYFIHEDSVSFDAGSIHSEGYASLLDEQNALNKREREGSISEDQKTRLAIIRRSLLHNRMFPEKVLKYLWDDAFKFNPEALFDTGTMDSLEKVIRTFVYAEGIDRFKVFNEMVRDSLYPAQ